MQNPPSKKIYLVILKVFIFLLLFAIIPKPLIVKADNTTIEVNPSGLTQQSIGYYGSGFLLTLLPSNAPKNLISDIKPRLFRTQNPWIFQDSSYQRSINSGAEIQYLVYETFFTANAYKIWPGDNGDWSLWENSVRTAVQQVLDKGLKVEYEIWNEPDYEIFWQRDDNQFFETWKRAFNIIKEMAPNASIAGPSLSSYSLDYLSNFLTFAKANNVIPNTIVWHELDRDVKFKQIENRLVEFRAWAKNNGINFKRIVINEIVSDKDFYYPGTLVNFLAILERNQILGAHSCWEDPKSAGASNCWNSTLNGIVSTNFKPRSSWWTYKYYAELTGKLFNLKFNNNNIGGLATANNNEVKLLIGADSIATNNITINYRSPWNTERANLTVMGYYLKDVSGNETEPEIKTQNLEYTSKGSVINIDGLAPFQAVYIKIIEDTNFASETVSSELDNSPECSIEQISKNNKCIPLACKADIQGDGTLDDIDFAEMVNKYKVKPISCEYDIVNNGDDCEVNLIDLAKFASSYKIPNICQ